MVIGLGKLIRMAQYDPPFTILSAVCLRASKRPRLRVITRAPAHVFEINGEGKVPGDRRHDVLNAPFCSGDAFRRPVEARTHLFPAALVAAECAHDHYVVCVGPQRLERFRSSLNEVTKSSLAERDELLKCLVHAVILPAAGVGRLPTCEVHLCWCPSAIRPQRSAAGLRPRTRVVDGDATALYRRLGDIAPQRRSKKGSPMLSSPSPSRGTRYHSRPWATR